MLMPGWGLFPDGHGMVVAKHGIESLKPTSDVDHLLRIMPKLFAGLVKDPEMFIPSSEAGALPVAGTIFTIGKVLDAQDHR